jgi:hypothetical protein
MKSSTSVNRKNARNSVGETSGFGNGFGLTVWPDRSGEAGGTAESFLEGDRGASIVMVGWKLNLSVPDPFVRSDSHATLCDSDV